VRDEGGLVTDGLRIGNERFAFTSSGVVSSQRTDIGFEASLADLALLSPELSGALTATGRARSATPPASTSPSSPPSPKAPPPGGPSSALALGFDGRVAGGTVTGALAAPASSAARRSRLAADILASEDERRVSDLVFSVGPNRFTGDALPGRRGADRGQPRARRPRRRAPSPPSRFVEAQAPASADIALSAAEVGQGIAVEATLRDLVVEGPASAASTSRADVVDAFGLPLADATLAAADLVLGGIAVETLDATARGDRGRAHGLRGRDPPRHRHRGRTSPASSPASRTASPSPSTASR
jgi:translocation and assembly module TamB